MRVGIPSVVLVRRRSLIGRPRVGRSSTLRPRAAVWGLVGALIRWRATVVPLVGRRVVIARRAIVVVFVG